MASTNCPSHDELAAYLLGKIPESVANAIEMHLASCHACEAILLSLPGLADDVIAALRGPEPAESYHAEPEYTSAIAKLRSLPVSGTPSSGQEAVTASVVPVTAAGQLGEYQLLSKLGQGGMGTVYKALHTKLQRVVALKLLPKREAEDEQAVGRFEREMAALGRLKHPNIVQAFDAREVAGTRFLAMELVEGLDLSHLVQRCGPLPVPDACELIRQAALGLHCAHQCGLVHRDVKPANLMLAASGEVKVLDLGLARLPSRQLDGDMTGTGQAMGSADYMSPEQASDSHRVDIRADIYSLGCTLYKLLTGQAPFSGLNYQSNLEKLIAHRQEPVPPIGSFRPEVPNGLAAVLDRMLAKSPDERFPTAADVAASIAPFCDGNDLRGLLAHADETILLGADQLPVPPRTPSPPAVPGPLASPLTGTQPPHLTRPPRHEVAARFDIGQLGCGVMVTLASLLVAVVTLLYFGVPLHRRDAPAVAMVEPSRPKPKIAGPSAEQPVRPAETSPPAQPRAVAPVPMEAAPPPRPRPESRASGLWEVSRPPRVPNPRLPSQAGREVASAGTDSRHAWLKSAKEAVWLLQVEQTLPDGSTAAWPFATCCAVSEKVLLTTGNVGCELLRFRTKKFRIYATRPQGKFKEEVTEIRICRDYLDHEDNRLQRRYYDLTLLSVAGRLPSAVPVATQQEFRWVEEGDDVILLGYPHNGNKITPNDRFSLQLVEARVFAVRAREPQIAGTSHCLDVIAPASLLRNAYGFGVFRSDGKLVGVYNEPANENEARGVKNLHFITAVQPEWIERGLRERDGRLWVEPKVQAGPPTKKP